MSIQKILVPTDFSPLSLQALDYAVEFGRPSDAEFSLLHVVEPTAFTATSGTYGAGYDAGIVLQELEQAARVRLAQLADGLRTRGIQIRTLLAVGTPHAAIADAAKKLKADLVVMSTHGRSGLSHVFMGSVAERVVRTSTCPVLTIHPRGSTARRQPARRKIAGRMNMAH